MFFTFNKSVYPNGHFPQQRKKNLPKQIWGGEDRVKSSRELKFLANNQAPGNWIGRGLNIHS
jgi:hypothetical protein